MLVEVKAAQDRAMTSEDVGGIFDVDTFQSLVIDIRNELVDRTHQPFARVDDVCQRILDGTTAGFTAIVVDFAIRRSRKRSLRVT